MSFTPQHGDCLVMFNMPWFFTSIIDWASEGQPCHHCAIVLPPPSWEPYPYDTLWVYEAWEPRSRYMTWDAYLAKMNDWAHNWRYKRGRGPFCARLLRGPWSEEQIARLHAAAEALLDIRYNMVANWARGVPAINCSELGSRSTVAAHMTTRGDYVDRRGERKRLDQATPWEWYQALLRAGAKVVQEYMAENLEL